MKKLNMKAVTIQVKLNLFFQFIILKNILLDIFCTKCRGRGHNANDCREKERGSYRGKQEYNNR